MGEILARKENSKLNGTSGDSHKVQEPEFILLSVPFLKVRMASSSLHSFILCTAIQVNELQGLKKEVFCSVRQNEEAVQEQTAILMFSRKSFDGYAVIWLMLL